MLLYEWTREKHNKYLEVFGVQSSRINGDRGRRAVTHLRFVTGAVAVAGGSDLRDLLDGVRQAEDVPHDEGAVLLLVLEDLLCDRKQTWQQKHALICVL